MPAADLGTRVVDAVADDRPAVVGARFDQIELIAAARTVLDGPDLAACRIDRERLGIAMPVTPDLGPGISAPDEGIVLRDAAIRIQARHLAEIAAQILRLPHGLR